LGNPRVWVPIPAFFPDDRQTRVVAQFGVRAGPVKPEILRYA